MSTSPADAVANLRSAFDSTREAKENSSLDKLAAVIAGLKPAEPAEGAVSLGAALDKLASTLASTLGAMSKSSEPSINKIAAQSATKERQKLTFTFHKDLIEAIILLHTAARSSELEGDHLPAAQFVAGRLAGNQLTVIITHLSDGAASTRWDRTKYENFSRMALSEVHGENWMNEVVKRKSSFKIDKQPYTMATKEYVQSVKDTAAPFEWAFTILGKENGAAATMQSQWLEDIQQRTVNGLVVREVTNHLMLTVNTDQWGKASAWTCILNYAMTADNWGRNRMTAPDQGAPAASGYPAPPPAMPEDIQKDNGAMLAAVLEIKEIFFEGIAENVATAKRREEIDRRTSESVDQIRKETQETARRREDLDKRTSSDVERLRKDSASTRDDLQRLTDESASIRRDTQRINSREIQAERDYSRNTFTGTCLLCNEKGHMASSCTRGCYECGGLIRNHKQGCSNRPKHKGGKGGNHGGSPNGRGKGKGSNNRDGYNDRGTTYKDDRRESKTEKEHKSDPKNDTGRN